jgi:hypothetical protein
MRTGLCALLAFGTIGSTACAIADLFDRGPSNDPSLIVFYSYASGITAPDTVSSGTPFQVQFPTYGGGCSSVGGDDMTRTGAVVVISPYDHDVDKSTCPDVLHFMKHLIQVRIDVKGSWTIRVVGQRRDGPEGNQTAELTREVFVR